MDEWAPVQQGLIKKRTVAKHRLLDIAPGQAEKEIVNGLIMDIFNIFISQKLVFEKREMPPMDLDVNIKRKDLLFTYSLQGGTMFLLATGVRKGGELVAIDLILTPYHAASSDKGKHIISLLDGIERPYKRRCF